MSKEKPKKRYCLKVGLTPEEKAIVWAVYGPNRFVTARIKAQILDFCGRKNPDQWAAFVGAVTAVERILEQNLKAMKPDSPDTISDFVKACYSATKLLEELRHHEP